MSDLWTSLIPLIIGSALVPIQIVVTTLLLRSKAGRIAAVAWVAGMTTVRLAQGLVFGLLLGAGNGTGSGTDGPDSAVSLLLLVLAIVFYVSAAKQLLQHPDEDAPPPKWMATVEGVTPGRAYLLGVGLVIAQRQVLGVHAGRHRGHRGGRDEPGRRRSLTFLALRGPGRVDPPGHARRSPSPCRTARPPCSTGSPALLQRYNRVLVVGLGLVFGTWFLVKALDGLGVL